MGPSLCGWMLVASFMEKKISVYEASNFPKLELVGEPSMVRIWRAYLLWTKLVFPPPTNPSAVMLKVCCTTLLLPSLLGSFYFLDQKLPKAYLP